MRVPLRGRAREGRGRGRLWRRVAAALAVLFGVALLPLVFPTGGAVAAPCDLSGDLTPELVGGGVDGLMKAPPPDPPAGAAQPEPAAAPMTNYERYGTAGQFWHTYELGCNDLTAVLGNAWANTVFSWAKALDQLTLSTYQAAATEGPLQSIKDVVDDIVTNLADAMYWPYLRVVVILAAIWLAWYGLIRKRASTTTEGVVWMVLAVTAAVWFFSRPGDFTGLGAAVTDKTGEVVNSAFAGLPGAEGASCLPLKNEQPTDPKVGYGQPGTPGVQQNTDLLWSTLVCKPWLMGAFGTADPAAPVVREMGPKLLDIQALDVEEQRAKQLPAADAHQNRYEQEIAEPLRGSSVFFVFQGKDWANRLGIAIGALIAALVAGLLIFLVAVSLLALKIGFLLLLILGPVFLLIGVHPGSGRIIAMRWLEMLIGTLLRQAVLALVLGVLVYGYSLIIATSLPWLMQIMLIALLTIAVFFYRRPFQHLFASLDGHTFTTRMLGEATTAPTLSRAANVLPPVAGQRLGRWGLRRAQPVINAMAMGGTAGAAAAAAGVAQGKGRGEESTPATPSGARVPVGAQPTPLENDPQANRRRTVGAAQRTGSAPPLNLSGRNGAAASARSPRPAAARPVASGTASASPGLGGVVGSGVSGAAGRSGVSGRSGASGGSGGSAGSGGSRGGGSGWFSGRPAGGWASRGSSSGGSGSRPSRFSGSSRGSRSGGSSGGSSRGSSGGSSGGGLFGGRSPGSSGGGLFGGGNGARRTEERPRSGSDAPPLWLTSRSDSGRAEDAPVPFWLKPGRRDGGED